MVVRFVNHLYFSNDFETIMDVSITIKPHYSVEQMFIIKKCTTVCHLKQVLIIKKYNTAYHLKQVFIIKKHFTLYQLKQVFIIVLMHINQIK